MTDYTSDTSKKKTKFGTKARQRDDKEDRTIVYRDFRRDVGKTIKDGRKRNTCYVSDLDQIEYIFVDNVPIPVAVLEITRYDFDENKLAPHSWAKYRTSILNRYFTRDAQGKFIVNIAKNLNCLAYIVLFRCDVESFWVFDLLNNNHFWKHFSKDEYIEWLVTLREHGIRTHMNE